MRRAVVWRILVLLVPSATSLSAQTVCATPWTLEQTLSLGASANFTNILDLAVGRDGKIYVTQSFTPSVLVFNAQGRPERPIGRAGQGPGEFRMMALSVGFKGDSLWATDLEKLEMFAPNGTPAYSVAFRMPRPAEGSTLEAGVPLPDGSFLAQRSISGGAFYEVDRFPLLRFSRAGQILDTIAVVARPSDEYFVEFTVNRRTSRPEHPFHTWSARETSGLQVALTADGAAVILIGGVRVEEPGRSLLNPLARATTASFDLVKIAINGDTILKRSITYEPQPVTRREADWLRDEFAGRYLVDSSNNAYPSPFETGGSIVAQMRSKAARDAITFPDYHPPVRQIVAGEDGTIWLLREMQMDWVERWEAYDANGQRLGSVHISEGRPRRYPWLTRLRVLRASRDELWGVTEDELGVQTLRRFRLRNPCS